jgi:CRISPR-associated protein Cst1
LSWEAIVLNLDYTGHPFFDVGLATVVAHVDKDHPTELDEDDLEKVAQFIETHYTEQPLTSFLTVSLMNSDFTQPAFKDNLARRQEYARLVAGSFGANAIQGDEVCVFTGRPALGRSLSLKKDKDGREVLPPGRAYRQHIPLITGEDIINFSPAGDPGLPVSGEALLCLQFFPIGCRKCAGRLLAIHSDNPAILLAAARQALDENIEAITLAKASNEKKLPDASSSASRLLIETIIDLSKKQSRAQRKTRPFSVTAYHLTNSGQSSPLDEKSPPLKIYPLPMSTIRFLQVANHPDYQATWNILVARGWPRPKLSKSKTDGQKSRADPAMPLTQGRNYFYEALLRLPEDRLRFVRTYFLRVPELITALARTDNITQQKRPLKEQVLVTWPFVVVFLEEVMHMDKQRIDAIGKLGETLAAYVDEFDDQRFLNNFYREQQSGSFRNILLKALRNAATHGKPPLFRYKDFCTVFFELNDETLRLDWKLARDLAFIRMLEWLYDHDKKLQEHMSALAQEQDRDETSAQDDEQ